MVWATLAFQAPGTLRRRASPRRRIPVSPHHEVYCGWEQIPRYLTRDRDGAYAYLPLPAVLPLEAAPLDHPCSGRTRSNRAPEHRVPRLRPTTSTLAAR